MRIPESKLDSTCSCVVSVAADKALDKDEWAKIFNAAVAKGTIKKDHSNRTGISGR